MWALERRQLTWPICFPVINPVEICQVWKSSQTVPRVFGPLALCTLLPPQVGFVFLFQCLLVTGAGSCSSVTDLELARDVSSSPRDWIRRPFGFPTLSHVPLHLRTYRDALGLPVPPVRPQYACLRLPSTQDPADCPGSALTVSRLTPPPGLRPPRPSHVGARCLMNRRSGPGGKSGFSFSAWWSVLRSSHSQHLSQGFLLMSRWIKIMDACE